MVNGLHKTRIGVKLRGHTELQAVATIDILGKFVFFCAAVPGHDGWHLLGRLLSAMPYLQCSQLCQPCKGIDMDARQGVVADSSIGVAAAGLVEERG